MAVREMGREVERAGGLFRQGSHHGFLWNQMLFTLRRTIYSVTLGLAAMATAAVAVGFHFNSMIEQQTIAFTKMTGSAAAANKEVTFLFNLAATGPFQFQQVIAGARQLMAFSYTVKETNQVLTALQDAMAGMGLDQAQLDRATLALGEIRSIGVLQGRQVRQLEQLGLLNREVLAKGLGVNPLQVANVAQLHVPWQRAINIITNYWRQRFKGAAKDFQQSWIGLTSTIKDYGSQVFGAMALPLQHRLERNIFPKLRDTLKMISNYYRTSATPTFGGALGVVDQRYGTHVQQTWNDMAGAGRQLWAVVVSLEKAFYGAWSILTFGGGPLTLVKDGLWAINKVLWVLSPLLKYLITLWIIDRTAILAVAFATKAKLAWDVLEVTWMRRRAFWTSLLTVWRGREALAIGFNTRAKIANLFVTQLEWNAEKRMWVTVFRNNSLLAVYSRTILTRVIPAVVAAAAATWTWAAAVIAAMSPIYLIIAGLAVLGVAIYEIVKHWKDVVYWMKEAWGWLTKISHASIHPEGWEWRPWRKQFWMPPGLQQGGHVLTGGVSVVGERGPELLTLPPGATVAPLGQPPLADLGRVLSSATRGGVLQIRVPLYLDRRQLAEATASVDLDTLARA